MNSIKATMMQAMQGMRVQSERIDLTSQNISNADTPGYQRKMLIVDKNGDAFRNLRIQLDQTEGDRSYEPAHPMADENGYITMSNVQVVTEMADMREANRSYEANLNSFQQARTMYKSLLDVLKR
ncbi:MAG TPA: flagellar basal body rod protein FlgC [Henriciella marina]|uniref:flagellar basal body rod C-terminal domain-containing protein n=1 Tax=Henriciella sp. TaxID=1968823 RepID=UPI0018009891|nr:flagellar basal body rod C-terminal domain-containing protein [Henriciella sp.]HIG21656.1 flagellar basal body rod protein FlgC [Henriciella sp.]HIK65485.1 flagellar basal body rod protein FlgC [Henriciella marina]